MNPDTNVTYPLYGQWGVAGLSAFVDSVFACWIIATNLAVVLCIVASAPLRSSRESLCILHITVSDLVMGFVFAPLTVDYFVKHYWPHGCDLVFYYTVIPYFCTFIAVHSVGLMSIFRLLSDCCRVQIGVCLKRFLLLGIFVLLWFYLMMVIVSARNFAVHTTSFRLDDSIICQRGLLGTLNNFMLGVFVLYAPMIVCIILLIVLFMRAKTDLYNDERGVFPFKLYAVATAVSCLLPLPSFLLLSNIGNTVCLSHNCQVIATITYTVLIMKSGIMPCVWLLNDEFRKSLKRVLSLFKRDN